MKVRIHPLLRRSRYQCHSNSGFTIVELLVVIVVIGVLAAITIVAYTGISQKAVASSLISDLDNSARKFKLYYVDNGQYPGDLNPSTYCPISPADPRYCIKASPDNSYTYASSGPSYQSFTLKATHGSLSYMISDNTSPILCGLNDATGGAIVTDTGIRTHTFTSNGTFTLTGCYGVTATIAVSGGGGGGGGGSGASPGGSDGGSGTMSSLTFNGTTYTANADTGGTKSGHDGGLPPCFAPLGVNGTNGSTITNGLTGGLAGNGGAGGKSTYDSCYGGNGGSGGKVTGSLNIGTGQSFSIIVGSSGASGARCVGSDCSDATAGAAGGAGIVTVSYPQ